VKFKLDVKPDLSALMLAEYRAAQKAVTVATKKAAVGLKEDWRGQVTRAGLGRRLANTIRAKGYPEAGQSIAAAGFVWTKAPDIIDAHDKGGVIRSPSGLWLTIPLPAAGRRGAGGKRITPKTCEDRTGQKQSYVYRRGKPGLLVADGRLRKSGIATESRSKTGRGRATIPIFVVVPFVRLRDRLDLDRDARKWQARLPGMIVDEWTDRRIGG
jgi:hypothetical protein